MILRASLLAFVAALGLGFCWWRLAPAPPAPPAVLASVEQLARLEGARFHLERVVELTQSQQRLWGLVETSERILLVAGADFVAGVDLSRLGADAVELGPEPGAVQLRLPPIELLGAHLDESRTYVFARDSGILARPDPQLEGRVRRRALTLLSAAAKDAALTRQAQRGVENALRLLLKPLGYDRPRFTWAATAVTTPVTRGN